MNDWSSSKGLTLAELPRTIAAGAAAGAVATVAMSAVMIGLQRLGLLGRTPPRHIVEHALGRFGLRHRVSPRSRRALSAVAHLGFGATQGAVYALGHHGTAAAEDGVPQPSARSGIPFALAVWASSYSGWIPRLGILPPPSRDRPGRPTTMVLAHVVYGAVLAKTLRLLLQPKLRSPVRDHVSDR